MPLIRVLVFAAASLVAQTPNTPAKIHIQIISGEGPINYSKTRVNRETIVEVQDENNRPVAGAAILFLLPGDGSCGVFADGSKLATLVAALNGQARMPHLTP